MEPYLLFKNWTRSLVSGALGPSLKQLS
jgi:hypothetical protein